MGGCLLLLLHYFTESFRHFAITNRKFTMYGWKIFSNSSLCLKVVIFPALSQFYFFNHLKLGIITYESIDCFSGGRQLIRCVVFPRKPFYLYIPEEIFFPFEWYDLDWIWIKVFGYIFLQQWISTSLYQEWEDWEDQHPSKRNEE